MPGPDVAPAARPHRPSSATAAVDQVADDGRRCRRPTELITSTIRRVWFDAGQRTEVDVGDDRQPGPVHRPWQLRQRDPHPVQLRRAEGRPDAVAGDDPPAVSPAKIAAPRASRSRRSIPPAPASRRPAVVAGPTAWGSPASPQRSSEAAGEIPAAGAVRSLALFGAATGPLFGAATSSSCGAATGPLSGAATNSPCGAATGPLSGAAASPLFGAATSRPSGAARRRARPPDQGHDQPGNLEHHQGHEQVEHQGQPEIAGPGEPFDGAGCGRRSGWPGPAGPAGSPPRRPACGRGPGASCRGPIVSTGRGECPPRRRERMRRTRTTTPSPVRLRACPVDHLGARRRPENARRRPGRP